MGEDASSDSLGSPGKQSHEAAQRTFPAIGATTSSNLLVAFLENPRLGSSWVWRSQWSGAVRDMSQGDHATSGCLGAPPSQSQWWDWIVGMTVSWGCCNKRPHTGGPRTTEQCSPRSWRPSSSSKHCQGARCLQAAGEGLPCLFQLLVLPGVAWLWPLHPSLCLCCLTVVSLVPANPSQLFLIRTAVIGFRAHPDPA